MSGVRLRFLSWLADMLDVETTGSEVILEQKIEREKTVSHLLNELAGQIPIFGQVVFDTRTQRLSDRVCIFLNDRHLELINGLNTELADGDVLTFVPLIEGG